MEQEEVKPEEDVVVQVEEIEENNKLKENEQDDSKNLVIDTSMYEYSKEVEVTDAIDINEYVSLIIRMNDNLEEGMAFQHASNQTYEFLQQDIVDKIQKENKAIGTMMHLIF